MSSSLWRLPSVVAGVVDLFVDSRESPSNMPPPSNTSTSSTSLSQIEEFYRANPQAQKPRPERQRDVLFGAGCGLLCFGLFPFSASAAAQNDSPGSASAAAFLADELETTTRTLSMVFSLLGLLCVTLSCVVLTRARLRAALLVIIAPLFVCIVVSCSTIIRYSTVDDVVNVLLHTRVVSSEQEHRIELSVNSLFCDAHARTLCETRDITRARDVFDLRSLDDIHATCTRLNHHQTDSSNINALMLIAEPSSNTMQWCGIYMTSREEAALVEKQRSPYNQHRLEVLDRIVQALSWRQARLKLLMVLEWFALPAFLAVVWWWRSPSAKIQATIRHIHIVV